MKKNLFIKGLLVVLLTNFSFGSDMLNVDTSQNFNYWIKQQTKKFQYIAIGTSEKGAGIKYTVNANPIPLDTSESNFYTTFEANDKRVEAYETYDVLKNWGLKPGRFYVRPGLGFGIDTASGSISGFGLVSLDYNFQKFSNWIASFQIKGFFLKQHSYTQETVTNFQNGKPYTETITECADNDCSNQRIFFSFMIGYKF